MWIFARRMRKCYSHGSITLFFFMANDTQGTNPEESGWSFISQSTVSSKVDTVYSDFFQETSDGKISVWSKARTSGLEMTTTVLSYILPVAIVWVLLASAHVFFRNQESWWFAENYPFLCPYMNYGVELESKDRWCNTVTALKAAYTEKQKILENDILKKLNEYIPIKITKNLMDTSPEKNFIVSTYDSKIHVDEIMDQFQKVLKSAQYTQEDNIECTWLSINGEWILSTLCTISWRDVGEDNTNGRLGSARIEALNFVDILSNTSKSGFILLNPPTSLSITDISENEDRWIFTTQTTLPIQIKYTLVTEAP